MIKTRHRAVTPNPTATIIVCLALFCSEQGLESGKTKRIMRSNYLIT